MIAAGELVASSNVLRVQHERHGDSRLLSVGAITTDARGRIFVTRRRERLVRVDGCNGSTPKVFDIEGIAVTRLAAVGRYESAASP